MIIIVIRVDFGIRYIGKIDTVVIIVIASFNSGLSINNMNRHGITVKAARKFDCSGGCRARSRSRHVIIVMIDRIIVDHCQM